MDAGFVDSAHRVFDWGHLPTLLGFPAVHEYVSLPYDVSDSAAKFHSSLAVKFGPVRALQHLTLAGVCGDGETWRMVAREVLLGRPRSRNCLLFFPWLSVHRAIHVYVGVLDRAQ